MSATFHRPFQGSSLKSAAKAKDVINLVGTLYVTDENWGLLSVPNEIVRGFYAIIDDHEAELPKTHGRLNAHISVFRPEDIDKIGGKDKLRQRGRQFRWSPLAMKEVAPAGWKEMSKVWFLEVKSPELEALRASYKLPASPRYPFHLTIAVKRKAK